MESNNGDYDEYLRPTRYLDFNRTPVCEKIKEIIDNLDASDKRSIAVKIFHFVRDQIRYDLIERLFTRRDLKSSVVLRQGKGFCVQKAVLLTSMARGAGIPTRLHFADIRNYRTSKRAMDIMKTNLFVWHGYAEFYLDGKWIKANPAFNKTLCEKKRLPIVEFDGYSDAIFSKKDLDGNKFVEYVKDHGTFVDVPYKLILNDWFESYADYFNLNRR